jgi:hypothetical protein
MLLPVAVLSVTLALLSFLAKQPLLLEALLSTNIDAWCAALKPAKSPQNS